MWLPVGCLPATLGGSLRILSASASMVHWSKAFGKCQSQCLHPPPWLLCCSDTGGKHGKDPCSSAWYRESRPAPPRVGYSPAHPPHGRGDDHRRRCDGAPLLVLEGVPHGAWGARRESAGHTRSLRVVP